jgi:hypothetical protein
MSVSETDLEMLETWLDGELPDEQILDLRKRLAVETDLHQAMDRLRSDRQMRAQLWPTFEGSDAEVDTLVNSVRHSVQQDEMWNWRLGALRKFSGIAASIALVFMAGWITHSRLRTNVSDVTTPQNSSQVALNTPDQNQIHFMPLGKNFNLVGIPTAPSNIQNAAYQMQIIDRNGRVIAMQPLNNVGDPQKFVSQMVRTQPQQQGRQPSDPVLVDHQQQ